MMEVPIVFRTDDRGRWGFGAGRDLEAAEVDGNFWELKTALEDFFNNPPTAKTIAFFAVSASTGLTITMSDGAVFGPFPVPVVTWRWRGDWAVSTVYSPFDTFTVAHTGVYLVVLPHTSALTFDPLARDGDGNPLYIQLLALERPPLALSNGTQLVTGVDTIYFTGATVTDLGGGAIDVTAQNEDEDVAQLRTVTLSSADLLGAFTTPVEIIPAPGAGQSILPLGVFYSYAFGTTAYSNGANAGLYIDPTGDKLSLDDTASNMLHQGTSQAGAGAVDTFLDSDDTAVWENKPVVFTTSSALTLGDGTLKINVVYTVVPL